MDKLNIYIIAVIAVIIGLFDILKSSKKQSNKNQKSMKYKNNPLNIRYNKANKWQGQTEPKNGFCQFESLYYGLRAALKIVTNYHKQGYNTIDKIINRFAPSSENDTQNYVKFVTQIMGKHKDEVLKVEELKTLIYIQSKMESGSYTDKDVINSIKL